MPRGRKPKAAPTEWAVSPTNSKIRIGFPMPPTVRASKWPWLEMQPGDMFVYGGHGKSAQGMAASATRRYKRRFVARQFEEGGKVLWGIWRMEK